jgi:hypothetical protein
MSVCIDRIVVPPGWSDVLDSNTDGTAFVQRPGLIHHGFIAEAPPQPVDCVLGLGAAAIDEVGEIGVVGIAQPREPDADEPKHRTVGFARQ